MVLFYRIGTSQRKDLSTADPNLPGPGQYDQNGTIRSNKGFSLVPKRKTYGKVTSDETPGPGMYKQEVDTVKNAAPAFKIGTSQRKDLSTADPNLPGPGKYEVKTERATVGAKIGTSVRPGNEPLTETLVERRKVIEPGPGAYEITTEVGVGPKYPMGIKTNTRKTTENVPGPGRYEPFNNIYFEKMNGAFIGTGERPPLYKKDVVPGPGRYKVASPNEFGPKWRFGKAKRSNIGKESDEPGPGAYNLPSAIGNAPKYLKPKRSSVSQGHY